MSQKHISILGSTGSIGRQTISVIESLPGNFKIVALAAGSNLNELISQIQNHRPALVSVANEKKADELHHLLVAKGITDEPEIHYGPEGMLAVALHPQAKVVVSAAVGVVGLAATYEAILQGRTIALSNKEVLVAAGELVMAAAKKSGNPLLPVDSEHNAIHQCLRASGSPVLAPATRSASDAAAKCGGFNDVRRLILTASGGPFRKTPLAQLATATVDQALNHPKWRMGNRITIDSATMMNKGFEVIEARWLFDVRPDQIEVLIHPQSTIHSMVEFIDGSVIAQLGPTDMRLPIRYALTYPERVAVKEMQLDWSKLRRLDFAKASSRRFPCLRLAREAMKKGGALPCALNAADEVAVAAFLNHKIPFLAIHEVIEEVLTNTPHQKFSSVGEVLAADQEARRQAELAIPKFSKSKSAA